MSLLFNLEGPKGSGKSTLGKSLCDKFENCELRHFDSDNIVSNIDFNDIKKSDIIFDRGLLSYQIYDWLWNNGISHNINSDFSKTLIFYKEPLNKRHYDYLMSKVKYKYIILYSSDPEILINRIHKRNKLTNKGANELEWSTLINSNYYYEFMGKFLEKLYPSKVLLIDIAKTSNILELVLESINK